MLTYNKLKKKERSLWAFTGLSIAEFEALRLELLPLWEKDTKERIESDKWEEVVKAISLLLLMNWS